MTALPAPRSMWRFLDSGAADGVTNMAVDAALLDHARATGESTLRVYAWDRPTLSLGRHERARGRFDPARLAAEHVAIVRRPTGGRALLHDREVTYSVTAPVRGVSLGESYRGINALLLDALQTLGVAAAKAARRAPPLRPGHAPCFAEPNEGELVVGDAKLVGSAQWRDGDALLQHGSILRANDQHRIDALVVAPHDPAAVRVATLEEALGRAVSYEEVRDALARALHARCGRERVTSPSVIESDSGAFATVATHRARFHDASWTWRR